MTANPAPWPQTEAGLRGIFDRRWYTNHGPAAQALERRLAALLDGPEVVAVANPAIALLMLLEALTLAGPVVLPAIAPTRCVQALRLAGLHPAFCDVDPETGHMTAATVGAVLRPGDAAILAVDQWGGACDGPALAGLADGLGIPLIVDAGGSFGSHPTGPPAKPAATLYAFDAAAIVDGAGAGCLATRDAALAARLRNIRSSYGAGPPVSVARTANGRLSEAQAVFASLGLDNFAANRAHGAMLWSAYAEGLAGVPDVAMVPPPGVAASNGQAALCRVTAGGFGCGRDGLLAVLQAEGFAAAPVTSLLPGLPGADRFAGTTLCLPMGNAVTVAAARRLCGVVRATRPGR